MLMRVLISLCTVFYPLRDERGGARPWQASSLLSSSTVSLRALALSLSLPIHTVDCLLK